MVELTLPRNSKIPGKGKTFKAPKGAKKVKTFKMFGFEGNLTVNGTIAT